MRKSQVTFNPLPQGWFTNRDESVACPHRDIYVCPTCLTNEPQAVAALGLVYWAETADELALLHAMVNIDHDAKETDRRAHLTLVSS